MFFLRVAVLLGFLAASAQADTLRLRDGTVIMGTYVGGTTTEIWFQRSPAGAEPFPLFAVESLRFGNLIGSAAPRVPAPSAGKIATVKLIRRPLRQPTPAPQKPSAQKPTTLAMLFSFDRTQPVYLSRVISARLSP
jgi:hypothetical protein